MNFTPKIRLCQVSALFAILPLVAAPALNAQTGVNGNGRILAGYWHDWETPVWIPLRNVPSSYDIIVVAFANYNGGGNFSFTVDPAETQAQFISDINYLHTQGKKVLISLGGASETPTLGSASDAQNFANSAASIVQQFGFDGIDIDFENGAVYLNPNDTNINAPTTPSVVYLINGLKQFHSKLPGAMVTMAPIANYLQAGYQYYGPGPYGDSNWNGAYIPVIQATSSFLSYVWPQYYNECNIEALDNNLYCEGTDGNLVGMSEMLMKGFPVAWNAGNFTPLPQNKVLMGVPASPSASPGYLSDADLADSFDYLMTGKGKAGTYTLINSAGYPNTAGFMTWSINWDVYSNGGAFGTGIHAYLASLPPIQGGGPPQVADPVFSPAGGSFASAQNVAISTATSGASIRYTTDGSTPSETAGTLYSSPVHIGNTTTLKAIAYESGFTVSHVISATYTISGPPTVAAPAFSPGGGTYSSAQTVTITSSTGGATLRYTTDGSTPSETAGTVYSGPVSISATTTLKAIAYESGMTDSAVTSATYTINPGGGTSVSFEAENLGYTPNGATASEQTDANSSSGHWVVLAGNSVGDYIDFAIPSVNAGTYTLQMEWKGLGSRGILQLSVDGANLGPTLDQYSASASYPTTTFGTVTFASTGTHTIRLTVTGKNSKSSSYQLSADKFTFTSQGRGQQQVATPTFSPAGGTYSSAQTVTITSSTGGASIRYTTDGSTPSETAGTFYSGPVAISSGTVTLKAIAYQGGMTDSNVTSASYTISTGGTGTTVSFEAENLGFTPSGATASVQTDANSSGGKWVVLSGNSVGDYINYAIPSVQAGTYTLQMEWKGLGSRGILQLSVDGTNLGPTLDQYSASASYPTTTFGTVTFASTGTHTVRLTVTGKNSKSSSYQLSADKFTFVGQ